MATFYVKKDEIYKVTATTDCQVLNASGGLITYCKAAEEVTFKAPTSKVTVTDNNALLRKSVDEATIVEVSGLSDHIENTDVHTTAEEKQQVANVSTHVSDTKIHITADERLRWNDTTEILTVHIDSLAHVSSDEKTRIANAAQLSGAWNIFTNNNQFNVDTYFKGYTSFAGAENNFSNGINVLPLGTKTAMGANAYGLHVSASGGLQLFGTHFMIGDLFSDTSLKIVNGELSMYSTDEAAISFDYANKVTFRSMPDDGMEGTYKFECWQWDDDSHSSKSATAGVKLLKPSQVTDFEETSVLNKAELDANYEPKYQGTPNAVMITDSNGNISESAVITVSELNTLNNSYKNINSWIGNVDTRCLNLENALADIESRLAALENA